MNDLGAEGDLPDPSDLIVVKNRNDHLGKRINVVAKFFFL
jgi:hypothetical protein